MQPSETDPPDRTDKLIGAEQGSQLSLGDLMSRLVEDIRAWFDAEFALYRIEAARRSVSAGMAAAMILGALALAQAALVALLVGLVMWIAPATGMGLSILIVVGTTLVIVALLAWLGKRRIETIVDPDGKP